MRGIRIAVAVTPRRSPEQPNMTNPNATPNPKPANMKADTEKKTIKKRKTTKRHRAGPMAEMMTPEGVNVYGPREAVIQLAGMLLEKYIERESKRESIVERWKRLTKLRIEPEAKAPKAVRP